jgi:RNA polymerase-binding transcription factor DksA
MASLRTLMQDYTQHMERLEELRELLEERLAAARDELRAHGRDEPRRQIAAFEAAIERMDRGLYGTCRRCSAFIPFEMLLRVPQESLCVTCGGFLTSKEHP